MSYEFKIEDAFNFFSSIGIESRRKGDELEAVFCPYCHGGGNDKYTFSVNLEKGVYKCLRASCGAEGHFVELCRDFNYQLEYEHPKIYRMLPQPKTPYIPKEPALEYLESRGIGESVAKKYQITTLISNPSILVFPFFDENKVMQFIKYRNTKFKKGDKGNKEWCEKDTMPILFGMQQCKNFDRLIITEGQLDSLSVAQAGFDNAVSVPTGCNGWTWLAPCMNWVNQFEEVVVFGDYEKGKMTLLDKIKSIAKPTVKAVRPIDYLGEKDANDILTKYGIRAIQNCINNACVPDTGRIKQLSDVESVDLNNLDCIKTQITELDRVIGGMIMGQVILLTGKRGQGKSTFMSQLIAAALDQNERVFAYSGELADFHFKRWLDYQLVGESRLTKVEKDYEDGYSYSISNQTVDLLNEWYRGRAYIYDNDYLTDDKSEYESLTETILKAIKAFHVRLICIDNLMTAMDTVSHQNDLYLAQSNFVGELKKIAMQYQVCIILVAHPRKSSQYQSGFDNDDVSGSSDITNKVDIVLNYARATDRDKENVPNGVQEPNSVLQVTKNRLPGIEKRGDDSLKLFYNSADKRIRSVYECKDKKYGWETMTDEVVDLAEFEQADESEMAKVISQIDIPVDSSEEDPYDLPFL